MKKIQQFQILKITSERILDEKYNIDLTYSGAIKNNELISISDSELVRTIHRIRKSPYTQSLLSELQGERKKLSRKKNSKVNRRELSEIDSKISTLLFLPDIVNVLFTNKRHAHKIIKRGFTLNGKHFVPFMASSGMVRRNIMMFVNSEIDGLLTDRFDNGRSLDAKIVPAKYGVYFSLYSSSSLDVTFPRIAVVKDKMIKQVRKVDFTTITGDGLDPITSPQDVELETNAFDGQGLVSPRMAKVWASDLDLDYVPSAFIVRASFLKGLCVTFDFHKFAKEKGIVGFTDIYGNYILVKNIDVIISESQFKLWSSYSSTQSYLDHSLSNELGWGITRFTPKEERNYAFSSYQFIQSLDIKNVAEICKPTEDWMKGLTLNKNNVLVYLLGDTDYDKGWFDRLDPNLRAVLLENELIHDSYFKDHVEKSIEKKKHDSCMGRLIFPANYQFMIADPYAQSCHVFGLADESLLTEGFCYSQYWNERDGDEIALVRSPIVHTSEVHKLKLSKEESVRTWFKYITSGIVFPLYGVSLDMAILGGADVDGDIVFSTNYEPFIQGKIDGLPIFYNVQVPDKEETTDRTFITLSQAKGFGTKVGFLTNIGSTIASMLSDFPKESWEHSVLLNRYKYIRSAQGMEIDKQKGLVIPDFPIWWTKMDKDMSPMEKSITVTKRPYFFRYLYPHMNKKYISVRSGFDNMARTFYGMSIDELEQLSVKRRDQQALLDHYRDVSPFIDNDSVMNRVSHYMENVTRNLGRLSKNGDRFDHTLILSYPKFKADKNAIEKMGILYKEYRGLKRSLVEGLSSHHESEYSRMDQIYAYINKKGYSAITSNSEELGNLAVVLSYTILNDAGKKFAWDCFGNEISENIRKRKSEKFVRVPIRKKGGSIKYLFTEYGMYLMNISDDN